MTSRTRDSQRAARSAQERRNASRTPAIYRGPGADFSAERPLPQQVNTRRPLPWRLFSGLLAASLVVILAVFFSADVFYVRSIAVSDLEYLSDREIFALSGIAGVHIFWVDPDEVRRNVLQSPSVADAQVSVGWGAPMVQISVQEREPAVVWEQAGIRTWVDVQGRVMRERSERDDLLRIAADTLMDGPPGGMVSRDVVTGALQIQALRPELTELRFHPDYGLGFTDPQGWQVWLGVGGDMREKLDIYAGLIADLQRRGTIPRAVYVINPDRPWISTF
jgi:cell division septal protein FtsQ